MKYRIQATLIFIFGCLIISFSSCGSSHQRNIRYLSAFNRLVECGINDQQNCLVFATLINEDTIRDHSSGYTHNYARLIKYQEIGLKNLDISKEEIKKLRDHDRHIKVKSVAENLLVNLEHFYRTLLQNAITKWDNGDKDPNIINILQISLDQNIQESKLLFERMNEFSNKHGLKKSEWEPFTPCKQPEY